MDNLLEHPNGLVDCWNDEQRMDFLCSAFPENVESNPEHWKNKSVFWIELIEQLCRHSTCVCVDYNMVEKWVKWKGRTPLGLHVVWGIMIKDGVLVSADDYFGDITRNASWVGWGVNTFIRKPTLWAAGKLLDPLNRLSPIKLNESKKKFICLKVFKEKSETLLQLLRAAPAYSHGQIRINSFANVCDLAKNIARDKTEVEAMLLYLGKDKRVVLFCKSEDQDSEKFVKFSKVEKAVIPPNECDRGLVRLEAAKKQLEEQISLSYSQLSALEKSARELVKKGDRAMAMNMLKQKRRSMLCIKQKESSLDNIHQLLLRLEQTNIDHVVMEAYKAGVAAYKESTKTSDLSYESVEAVMNDISSIIDHHDDISDIISTSINETNVSVDDLEEELNKLLSDQNEELVSNQTDADIAKLVTGMNSLNTGINQKNLDQSSLITKTHASPRKKIATPLVL